MKTLIGTAIVGLACGAFAASDNSLSYPDLVSRLTNLDALTVLPAAGENCAQWSSYDRKSRYDTATGKYIAWDANGDGDGIIRKENGQLVLAEMKGPGCIWRIWSAEPRQGRVRIYLDGEEAPAVDLPFRSYFDLTSPPFTRSALVHTLARGWNNYTPIPYQKSCKIVAEPGWGLYFQFVYETFPAATRVPTFKRELDASSVEALDRAQAVLAKCGLGSLKAGDGQKLEQGSAHIPAGKTVAIATLNGPGSIKALRLKPVLPPQASDATRVLRELALQIRWDGEAEPSVWSPIGDFFGTAPGLNPYESLPLGVEADGWCYSRWRMPFGQGAIVELKNDGGEDREVGFEILHEPLTRPAAELGRFHAKWHRDAFLPAERERAIDWTMLKTEGAGRFLGVMLHVWNPRGGWWGEGDEKFFVDGEKFPSTFGTGSEDYFGYAWCNPALFQNAYHNQTHNDGNNRGHVSVNRWQIADNVPFHSSFEGAIEKYYANDRPTLYAATVYWYLNAGGKDPYREIAVADRIGYYTNPPPVIGVKGAIEGERLTILSKTGGDPQEQDLTGFPGGKWSNDAHLWWINAKPGDKLELALPVPKSGKYALSMAFTKAPDYGIMRLYLDGQSLGEAMDFYDPAVVPTGVKKFGEKELSAGQHKLMVEIVGANDKAIKSYMFGLDYVKLDPLP